MFNKRHLLLCPSKAAAERNRRRTADGGIEPFYHQQARLLQSWEFGTIAPKGLILGELPQVHQRNHKLLPDSRTIIRGI